MTVYHTENSARGIVWYTLSFSKYNGTMSASEQIQRWERLQSGTFWLTIWEEEA